MLDWLFGPDDEWVTFYPTYGYQKDDRWIIPLRIWVHENRPVVESFLTGLAATLDKLPDREIDNFRLRMAEFVADDESNEKVRFIFDNDPAKEEYRVQEEGGKFPRSDLNGLLEGFLTLPAAKAKDLLQRQGVPKWLADVSGRFPGTHGDRAGQTPQPTRDFSDLRHRRHC